MNCLTSTVHYLGVTTQDGVVVGIGGGAVDQQIPVQRLQRKRPGDVDNGEVLTIGPGNMVDDAPWPDACSSRRGPRCR